MHRHAIIVLLILSIASSTMLVGCIGGSFGAGASLPLQILIVAGQFLASMALDQLIASMRGDGDNGGDEALMAPVSVVFGG